VDEVFYTGKRRNFSTPTKGTFERERIKGIPGVRGEKGKVGGRFELSGVRQREKGGFSVWGKKSGG